MTGNEKQNVWATEIKSGLQASVDEYTTYMPAGLARNVAQEITEIAGGITDARWWIDHRNDLAGLAYAVRTSNRLHRIPRPTSRDIPQDMYLTDMPSHVIRERIQNLRTWAVDAGLPADSACCHGRYVGLSTDLVEVLRSTGPVSGEGDDLILTMGEYGYYSLTAPGQR